MDDLQFSLIVLGGFAILGVLVHGLWTIRKNNAEEKPREQRRQPTEPTAFAEEEAYDSDEPVEPSWDIDDEPELTSAPAEQQLYNEPDDDQIQEPGFDELGIGKVRVVSAEPAKYKPLREESPVVKAPETKEPDFNPFDDMPEPPSSLMRKEDRQEPSISATEEVPEPQAEETSPAPVAEAKEEPAAKVSLAQQARNLVKNKAESNKTSRRQDPKLREDQLGLDFDDQPKVEPVAEEQQKPAAPVEQEVLVLNVKSPDDKAIPGAALLPMLLTLGFKFGDQDIFHRHVNSNGKGPVLFSLANMFKPGVFDIDNMENFSTQGLSLFMILPIEGDPHQVFNMMHNAARKLADEFGAQVLDSRRSLLTKQSLQQYVEKIREFERRRMLQKA